MPLLLLLIIWFMLFGSAIGSFLNVVIYRMPLGQSLSFPSSHCPKCKHSIRWYDNVPVFGWIFLRGKCRDCREPISVRYPLIEATCGLLFGVLSALVFYRTQRIEMDGVSWIFYAALLLITLLAAGMIQWDRRKVPWKLFVPVIVISLVFSWEFGFLHPVPYYSLAPFEKKGDMRESPPSVRKNGKSAEEFRNPLIPRPGKWYENFGGGIDAVLGGILGLITALIVFPQIEKEQRNSWVFAMICVGLSCGWQVAVFSGGITLISLFAAGIVLRMRPLPCLHLWAAVFFALALLQTGFFGGIKPA